MLGLRGIRGEKKFFFKKKNFFREKVFFRSNNSFTQITILISSKLFIWHLSRKIVGIENAGKEAAIEKSWTVIARKRINERASFVNNRLAVNEFSLSAEAGLEVLIKVTAESIILLYLLLTSDSGSDLGCSTIVESPPRSSMTSTFLRMK